MKTYLKQLLLVVMMLLVVAATGCKKSYASASASSEASKESTSKAAVSDALLDELIESTDMVNTFETAAVSILEQLGINDKGYINKIKEELPGVAKDIYKKHFTGDEIKQIIELNKDEVQQKWIKLTPTIMEEAFSVAMNYVNGEEAANPAVSADFQAAMNDYFEAQEFDKQMEQLGSGEDINFLRNTMMGICSKYFSVDEVKHLTELSKLPISVKARKETPAIQQEISAAMRSVIMNHMKKL